MNDALKPSQVAEDWITNERESCGRANPTHESCVFIRPHLIIS
jgi:hypothetical protein